MTPDHEFRDYRGRRVTVLGLGSFGGGVGAVQFLVKQGALVTVSDQRSESDLAESLAALQSSPPSQLHLGEYHAADFTDAELLVVNPAIRRDHPWLKLAQDAGIPFTSEINLFWQHQRGKILAVTGSNGKSTTTALIHSILQATGQTAWLGGNIGRSLLPEVDRIQPDDWVVLELSSFQLTDLDRLAVSPMITVITNFSPNHLDWHADLAHYRWAKQTMLRHQSATDFAVLNADDPDVREWPVTARRVFFGLTDHGGEGTFLRGEQAVWRDQHVEREFSLQHAFSLPGRHNQANALAAMAASLAAGVSMDDVQQGLKKYKPLPHRLQFVGEVQGRKFYNDSLATTPESAIVGIEAFTKPVVLLAGGYDKHVDLSAMSACIAQRVKSVALMGQTANTLSELITQHPNRTVRTSDPLPNFSAACRWAWEQSTPGDVILLSPGCASYDWFRNFSDRGTQFMQFVEELLVSDGQTREANS